MNRQELQKKIRHTVHQLIWEKGYASPLNLFLKMEKIAEQGNLKPAAEGFNQSQGSDEV